VYDGVACAGVPPDMRDGPKLVEDGVVIELGATLLGAVDAVDRPPNELNLDIRK